jgi:hypothetical protein
VTPTLAAATEDLVAEGALEADAPVATITAGWQDREGSLEHLDPGAGHRLIDLGLYERANRVAEADPELVEAHHATQRQLKELRRVYNLRLRGAMATWASISGMTGDDRLLGPEREDALAAIRALDRRHLVRVAEIRAAYEAEFIPLEREPVANERADLAGLLADVGAVVIAGGHVATLLNRLRMFGVESSLGNLPLIAWSAGAMAIGSRVVLFHDRPPWGPGNAEAFEIGLGLFDDLIPFPHASGRLALSDVDRMGRLAQRFAPDLCILMDEGARLDRVDDTWAAARGTLALDLAGAGVDLDSVAA